MTYERLSDLDGGDYPPSWVYDELVARFAGQTPPLTEFVDAARALAAQCGAMCAGASPMASGSTPEAPMYDLRFYQHLSATTRDAWNNDAGADAQVADGGAGYYDHSVCVICAPDPQQRVLAMRFES